jgi:phosphohistidine phosphatase
MKLFLVRHGEAEGAAAGASDAERRLTEEGEATIRAVAGGLSRMGHAVEKIVSSPLARAVQTAGILEEVLARRGGAGTDAGAVETSPLLLGSAAPEETLGLLEPGSSTLALVGHQPHLGRMAGLLLGLDPGRLRLSAGTALLLTAEGVPRPGATRLEGLWPPGTFVG